MKPQTKQEVRDRFENNQAYKDQALAVMKEPFFQAWLDAVLVNMGPFSVDTPFSQFPHIQDRIDGGRSAINHFLHRLITMPEKLTEKEADGDDSYVGFVTPTAIGTGTRAINR